MVVAVTVGVASTREPHASHVVATGPGHNPATSTATSPSTAPPPYPNKSEPPPLRVEAGQNSIDVTTVFGYCFE
jgi:hypothetical protein